MKDINFFSANINAVSSAKRKETFLLAAAACFLILLGTVYGITKFRIFSLQKEIQQSQDYLDSPEVAKGKKELEEKKSELSLLKQYDAVVTEITASIDNSDKVKSKLIEKINSTLPGGVKVLNMTLSQDNADIGAKAVNRTQIAELEHNLLDTGLFSKVQIGSIEGEDGSGSFSFSAKCTLKEVIEK